MTSAHEKLRPWQEFALWIIAGTLLFLVGFDGARDEAAARRKQQVQ